MEIAEPGALTLATALYLTTNPGSYESFCLLELFVEMFTDFDANAFIASAKERKNEIQMQIWVSMLKEIVN